VGAIDIKHPQNCRFVYWQNHLDQIFPDTQRTLLVGLSTLVSFVYVQPKKLKEIQIEKDGDKGRPFRSFWEKVCWKKEKKSEKGKNIKLL